MRTATWNLRPRKFRRDGNGGAAEAHRVSAAADRDEEPTVQEVLFEKAAEMACRASECVQAHGNVVRRLGGDELLALLSVGTAREWDWHRQIWRAMAKNVVDIMCEAPT